MEFHDFLGILAKIALFQLKGTSKPLKGHGNSCLFHTGIRKVAFVWKYPHFSWKSSFFMKISLFRGKVRNSGKILASRATGWKRQLLPCIFKGFEVPLCWKSAFFARIPRKRGISLKNRIFMKIATF